MSSQILHFSYLHFLHLFFYLQILPVVLDMLPFPNGIRLAAVASRNELVDLEKWLTSNISIYKDTFIEVLFKSGQFLDGVTL